MDTDEKKFGKGIVKTQKIKCVVVHKKRIRKKIVNMGSLFLVPGS
jgi:hypothetical protein